MTVSIANESHGQGDILVGGETAVLGDLARGELHGSRKDGGNGEAEKVEQHDEETHLELWFREQGYAK